jgi:hypothetical protein
MADIDDIPGIAVGIVALIVVLIVGSYLVSSVRDVTKINDPNSPYASSQAQTDNVWNNIVSLLMPDGSDIVLKVIGGLFIVLGGGVVIGWAMNKD